MGGVGVGWVGGGVCGGGGGWGLVRGWVGGVGGFGRGVWFGGGVVLGCGGLFWFCCLVFLFWWLLDHCKRGMIVKEHYGKIYMTDRGIFVAKEVRAQLERVLQNFPPVNIELTEEERFAAALALTSALPERAFVGEYERLFGTVSDEAAEPEKAG